MNITITANNESEAVGLDPKHPGAHDATYRERRNHFYRTCRAHRLAGTGMPSFVYALDEVRVWRTVLDRLDGAHRARACSKYLSAMAALGISAEAIPPPGGINETLRNVSGFQLAPAEGLLGVEDFFGSLARRRFPCTQYLRHGSDPSFTPEPDMVHDLVGHVPLLVDPQYAGLIELMGAASVGASPEQLAMLGQFYWFGIEFGLIEEGGTLKVFGSGLLSSYGEMEHALSGKTRKRPFELDEVIRTQYDPTSMQDLLFVIPSFAFLRAELERLTERLSRGRKARPDASVRPPRASRDPSPSSG